jgi:hypothetical protein
MLVAELIRSCSHAKVAEAAIHSIGPDLVREVGLRALAAVLKAVSGQAYRPRFESLERLFGQIGGGRLGAGATLHGCHIRPAGRHGKEFGGGALWLSAESPRKTGSSVRKA